MSNLRIELRVHEVFGSNNDHAYLALVNADRIVNDPAKPGDPANDILIIDANDLRANLHGGAGATLNIDPLVLDLDGGGVGLIPFDQSTAFFDVDNDGSVEHTGWVAAGDGLLVRRFVT